MLILSRKPREEIFIGDHIRLVVHRIAGNRVTLGILAPRDVPVIRSELQAGTSRSDETAALAKPTAAAQIRVSKLSHPAVESS